MWTYGSTLHMCYNGLVWDWRGFIIESMEKEFEVRTRFEFYWKNIERFPMFVKAIENGINEQYSEYALILKKRIVKQNHSGVWSIT